MAKPTLPPYNVGDLGTGTRRSAPAVQRNREPIAAVLRDWLPVRGRVLEVASGTGEHSRIYSELFPDLVWQPTDPDPAALVSITAWGEDGPGNLLPPLSLDAAAPQWPVDAADAVLNINMVHISPAAAALGLLDGAARVLRPGAPLILYGPWIEAGVEAAPSNLAFDADLKSRNPSWGLRKVEDFAANAAARGLDLIDRRAMPSNNIMLLFRRR
nr:DUF938 domain-containing protein [uncultured Sphingomonas sp.]